MRRNYEIALLAFVLAIATCLPAAPTSAKAHPRWSADLMRFAPPAAATIKRGIPDSVYVAATSSNVAAAVQGGDPTSGPWTSSLLIFDARHGKLRQKCGPWHNRTIDKLWATANGNFLIEAEPLKSKAGTSGVLLLFSPGCVQLQRADLSGSKHAHHRSWYALVSPTRHTLLAVERGTKQTAFTVRDTDTFAIRYQWRKENSAATKISSVSDNGLLALEYLKPESPWSPAKLLYQSFNAPAWFDLTDTLARENGDPFATFVSNDTFVEGAQIGEMGICNPTKVRVEVRNIDGRLLASKIFSRHAHAFMFPVGGMVASPTDGQLFASMVRSINVGWFWCNTDSELSSDHIFIWSTSRMNQIARVASRNFGPFHLPLAMAPDGTWFAGYNGGDLFVRPLRSRKNGN